MTIKQSDNLSENEWIRILQIVDLHASVSYNYWHLNVLYKLCVYYIGPYLIVITKREKIGDIDGRTVWKVVSTEVLSFKRTLLHLTEQQVCNIKLFIYLSRIYVKSNYVNSCNYQSSSNMFNVFNWSEMLALRILLFYINLFFFLHLLWVWIVCIFIEREREGREDIHLSVTKEVTYLCVL